MLCYVLWLCINNLLAWINLDIIHILQFQAVCSEIFIGKIIPKLYFRRSLFIGRTRFSSHCSDNPATGALGVSGVGILLVLLLFILSYINYCICIFQWYRPWVIFVHTFNWRYVQYERMHCLIQLCAYIFYFRWLNIFLFI